MKKPENHILVIFGASGDLTKRKLIPALYDLFIQDLLPGHFAILGVGRSPLNDDLFRNNMIRDLESFTDKEYFDREKTLSFSRFLHYQSINTSDAADYASLRERLLELEVTYQTGGNCIFYLATPPSLYEKIPSYLHLHGMNEAPDSKSWKRIIIEKPFGTDLQSARDLNIKLSRYFKEDQLYRIDHYLGKETVQNILVTRFSNLIFEPVWNQNYIHHIEITAAENIGIEKRGGYYDQSGALRDMVQNHLLQLLGLVAMEPPINIEANAIRNESFKVLKSLRPFSPEAIRNDIVRGQYTASQIRGEKIPGYRDEEEVAADSRTETFVAMKFYIDNWRWAGVPFYIRTGKRLPTRASEIVVHFKRSPHRLFSSYADHRQNFNQLILRIQPDEGILVKFGMKVPGAGFQVQTVNMDFHYNDLKEKRLPSAYERLLLDCMHGDATLYSRGDAVEASWEFVQPVLDAWKNDPSIPVHGYPAGTWGPVETEGLFDDPGITWRYPCKNLVNDGEYCEL